MLELLLAACMFGGGEMVEKPVAPEVHAIQIKKLALELGVAHMRLDPADPNTERMLMKLLNNRAKPNGKPGVVDCIK